MRTVLKGRRLSPGLVISMIALFVAISGVAGALPGRNSVDSGDLKRNSVTSSDIRTNNVKGSDIRNNNVTGVDVAESTLGTVPNATSANNATQADNAQTVGGRSAAELRSVSGFSENATVVVNLGAAFVNVTGTVNVTALAPSRILATGTAELFGADNNETGQCRILIDADTSLGYESDPDDILSNNQIVNSVTFATEVAAGAHSVNFQCRAATGTVGKDDAAVSVIVVPT